MHAVTIPAQMAGTSRGLTSALRRAVTASGVVPVSISWTLFNIWAVTGYFRLVPPPLRFKLFMRSHKRGRPTKGSGNPSIRCWYRTAYNADRMVDSPFPIRCCHRAKSRRTFSSPLVSTIPPSRDRYGDSRGRMRQKRDQYFHPDVYCFRVEVA